MTTDTDPLDSISKQSANVWWSANLGRPVPDFVPPKAYFQPRQVVARYALPLTLSLLALIFTPFAWAAWPLASHELRRARTEQSRSASIEPILGEGWLLFARGFSILLTLLQVVAITFLLVRWR